MEGLWIMKKNLLLLLASLVAVSAVHAKSPNFGKNSAPAVSSGLAIGYDGGMPLQAHFMISGFAQDFPLMIRFSIGHSFLLNPGIPLEARHVFINENSNGVPEKSASRWNFGFDLLHQINILSLKRAYAFGGIRYSHFTGTFDFIGGNEFFDVHSNQWGLAGGVESYFPINERMEFFVSLGAEYFFPAPLEGHDSSYSPDGEYVNRRENYTYADADRAINQPKFQPKVLFGINYLL
jgi:hypothetical protein